MSKGTEKQTERPTFQYFRGGMLPYAPE